MGSAVNATDAVCHGPRHIIEDAAASSHHASVDQDVEPDSFGASPGRNWRGETMVGGSSVAIGRVEPSGRTV